MADRFVLNIYGDKTLEDKFNRVKEHFVEKDPGINWTNSAVGAGAIDYVYQKIAGAETNANRITTIIERQDRQDATLAQLVATVAQLVERLDKGV